MAQALMQLDSAWKSGSDINAIRSACEADLTFSEISWILVNSSQLQLQPSAGSGSSKSEVGIFSFTNFAVLVGGQ